MDYDIKMTSTNEIRKAFLDFFEKNGHKVVPSSPLVPQNDPTLMFVNAGMVQFKDVFTGAEKREYTRAVSSQKCVRAGGKHNDLDNVGYTARHHTFFEMLGNFSFGDYFKEEAIKFAWEFLTEVLKVPKEKLLITVYHTDDEAFNIWKKLTGFTDEKIIRIDTNDNFWSMGNTGACGPCSEIFYDHGDEIAGTPPPNDDGDRYVEIWNLVFMQYEKLASGELIPLPKPSIDTGMGLERISAVMQGVHSNYDIDIFRNLIQAIADETGVKDISVGHNVIADHLRSCSFLIADGVLPSNEGRGYVVRRIMRRAMRYAHQMGCKDALMYKLVPALINEMGEAYPELKRAEALITENLKREEEKFKTTLGKGLKLLDDEIENLDGDILSGEVAFKLYDTYGFPLDLTCDILKSLWYQVDTDGFYTAMAEQKKRSMLSWIGSGEQEINSVWFKHNEKVGETEFLGYEKTEIKARVLVVVDGEENEVFIITDKTVFYGESGGQVGDTGFINGNKVINTIKPLENFIVHKCILNEEIKAGDEVILKVDIERRNKIRANHTTTHILHKALKNTLGEHVIQKGSQVADDKLRFDFAHHQAVSSDEIRIIEQEVNKYIRQNLDIQTTVSTPEEAIETGATALFGEKYGDTVRVVNMGEYSTELCGGIHANKTGDIGLFKIISERAIAAGIRRIEALTGEEALNYILNQEGTLSKISNSLKSSPEELEGRILSLLKEKKELENQLAETRKKLALGGGSSQEIEEINGVKFIGKVLDLPAKELKGIVDDLKNKADIVVVITTHNDKASIAVGVTKDLTDKYNAVDLVRIGSKVIGGKGGGGRPDMAQAGGSDCSKADDAINEIKACIT